MCLYGVHHATTFRFGPSPLDGLLVGDDLESLMFYDLDGSLVETQAIDGGVQSCHVMALKVVVLSGMGEVVLVQYQRDSVNLSNR